MKAQIKSLGLATVSLLAFESIGSTAYAQSNAADNAPESAAIGAPAGEIVVTARKRAESINDVPLSIDAFSGEQLTAIGAENFEDYAARVPGLSFNTRGPTSFRGEGVTLGIRGVSGGLSDPPVGFYIDDTPVGSVNLKLFDIERVEVLKGPQGTLYGARAMGGLIKIVTRKADPAGFASAGGLELSDTKGGGLNYRADAMVNVPLVQDVLAVRATGYGVFRQGTIDRLPAAQNFPMPYPTSVDPDALIKNEDDEKTYGGRVSLAYTPGGNFKAVAQYIYENAKLDGRSEWDRPLGEAVGQSLISGAFVREPSSAKFQNASLTLDYDFEDFATLTSNSSATWYKTRDLEDFTYFLQATLAGFGLGWNSPSENTTGRDRRILTQEVLLASQGKHPIDWQVGLFYQDLREVGTFFWQTPGVATAFNTALGFPFASSDLLLDRRGVTKTREFGAFAEIDWNLSDRLTATAGLRYFNNKFSLADRQVGIIASPPSDLSSNDDGLNPRFALAYKLNPDVLLYGAATKGFRRGGANVIAGIPATCNAEIQALGFDTPPATFKSDNLWHYEVGAKGSTAGGKLQLEAAVYHIDWRDKQQNVFLSGCGYNLGVNVGRSEIDGFEISATARPTPELTAGLSLGYIDARVAQDTPQANAFKGDRLPLAPQWTSSLSLAYEKEVAAGTSAFGRFDLQYRDKVIEPIRFTTFRDYVAINLRGGVNFDVFSVTAFVDNVTNDLAPLYSGSGLLVGQPNADRVRTLTPRTIGIELRYRLR